VRRSGVIGIARLPPEADVGGIETPPQRSQLTFQL
jgi:hypothetical protein